ncbi:MAG: hypothetical protein HOF74_08625 [Gammaproteobacteria bacterium]|nr:hypothetical protein [Gammaproteobacteria bacterium]MBT3859879.1 hypothetical protein [Gammaproteobacteria bacterium]MBT3986341.1 hypothetical protein [Gammaproteobacteria bacterium]MBT4256148.1 hypothetical protein [Gammaproteobacteria bacterium]MBT4582901.1 hypothetical protein [Gammaproteobacteria bacterium]
MSNRNPNRNKYSVYCKEHSADFANELRDTASTALMGWPGRTLAILLCTSSLYTFYTNTALENPYAVYTLFTYVIPILIVVLYPICSMMLSSLEKFSPLVLDLLCLSSLFGYVLTLQLVFAGANSTEDLQSLYMTLIGQTNFVLLLSIAISYHVSFVATLGRNIVYTFFLMASLYYVNEEFFGINFMQLIQGFFAGSLVGWIFFESIRVRFYLRSTDADTRQHLYNQLSKLVYPHQLERIKLGDELENTMPLKEGKAIVNVFDVQRSSDIRHEKTQDFFLGVFQSFLQICMKGYEHNPLRSRAFRLKETGDGFISTIGYPFLPIESRSLADSAVATALSMFEAFNVEVEKFNYSRPIKGAMGLAYNSVQGTFQSGGIRSYDLFGDALIQASKYEELRKQPVIWNILKNHANELGLDDFHILIVQEVVYNSLSPSYRDLFTEIGLNDARLSQNNFSMMYDNEAKYMYFHILE